MLDLRRRLLLCEIEAQCSFALKQYPQSTQALQRRDPEAFWSALQAILTAATTIYSLLAPDAALRAALLVPDTSPFLRPELARFRDPSFAFFDWLAAHPRGPLRMTNFGPFGVSPADPSVFARYLDPDHSIAVIFGLPFDVPELLAAAAVLQQAAAAELHQLQTVF
jgi:hypothetical protein